MDALFDVATFSNYFYLAKKSAAQVYQRCARGGKMLVWYIERKLEFKSPSYRNILRREKST